MNRLNYHRAHFIKSATSLTSLPKDEGAEVAFVGRSNAGKSSALNCITRKGLARTSKTPGRTQHLNVFGINEDNTFRLIDLPGYGYAKVPESVRLRWPKLINAYLHARHSLRGLVLVLDSRHLPKLADKQVLDWCNAVQLPIHLLLTKSDKLSRGAAQSMLHEMRKFVDKEYSSQVSLQLFSSKTRLGGDELAQKLTDWLLMTAERGS